MDYIGVDLGTSAVKLLLMDAEGRIRKIVSKEYPLSLPKPGWSEQNPQDWLDKTLEGLRELTEGVPPEEIGGIGIGGQMHGLVTLDKDDRPIRPAILWNDGRSQEETQYLNEVIGKEKLSAWTGNIAFAGFTAPKLLWMKKHESENFAKIAKIMLPKDYLVYRLSGAFSTDFSDASGMLLLDVKNRRWSREMCDVCGISEQMLPELHESYEVVGMLKQEIADKFGLKDVKIIAGAGDNAAAAVGTGVVGEGGCNISLGTSGTLFVSSASYKEDKVNALHSFCHADGGWHLMGCILSSASCNSWWVNGILQSTDYKKEEDGLDEVIGQNDVYFLPYLMGERSPHNDVTARGAFIGMRPDTTRKMMTLAMLEGVTFALRDCLEAAKKNGAVIPRTKLCGGGAKSKLWRKIVANVMNLPVDIPQTEQGPGFGAAMLAMVGCGEYISVQQAADAIVRIKETVLPDPEIAAQYEKRYHHFTKLYPALKGLF